MNAVRHPGRPSVSVRRAAEGLLRAGHSGNRRNSFTLLELLIVISILVILIALLLPALKGARETARTILCVGNLKQMSVAYTFYADRTGFCMPERPTIRHEVDGNYNTWEYEIMELLGGKGKSPTQALKCPVAAGYGEKSYGLNAVSAGYWLYALRGVRPISSILSPSQAITLLEYGYGYGYPYLVYDWIHLGSRHGNGQKDTVGRYVSGKINQAYFDGHVATLLRNAHFTAPAEATFGLLRRGYRAP